MNAAIMRLGRGWDDMNAAFMSYERSAGPVSAVTGVHKRLSGTAGTAGNGYAPVQDENRLSGTL